MKPYEHIARLVVARGYGNRPGLGSMPLAKAMGKPGLQSQIYKFLNGKVDEPERVTAEPMAAFLKIPVDAFYDEAVARDVVAAVLEGGESVKSASASDQVAQTMSHRILNNDPTADSKWIKWGAMKREDLPTTFWTEVPDNAMADRIEKGYRVKFMKVSDDVKPRADDGVLVADRDGRWFFRIYAPGAGDDFSAVALNERYPPIDSKAAGLTVLAVYLTHAAPEKRWG